MTTIPPEWAYMRCLSKKEYNENCKDHSCGCNFCRDNTRIEYRVKREEVISELKYPHPLFGDSRINKELTYRVTKEKDVRIETLHCRNCRCRKCVCRFLDPYILEFFEGLCDLVDIVSCYYGSMSDYQQKRGPTGCSCVECSQFSNLVFGVRRSYTYISNLRVNVVPIYMSNIVLVEDDDEVAVYRGNLNRTIRFRRYSLVNAKETLSSKEVNAVDVKRESKKFVNKNSVVVHNEGKDRKYKRNSKLFYKNDLVTIKINTNTYTFLIKRKIDKHWYSARLEEQFNFLDKVEYLGL